MMATLLVLLLDTLYDYLWQLHCQPIVSSLQFLLYGQLLLYLVKINDSLVAALICSLSDRATANWSGSKALLGCRAAD